MSHMIKCSKQEHSQGDADYRKSPRYVFGLFSPGWKWRSTKIMKNHQITVTWIFFDVPSACWYVSCSGGVLAARLWFERPPPFSLSREIIEERGEEENTEREKELKGLKQQKLAHFPRKK